MTDREKEKAIEELELLKEEYWDDDGYGHETKQYEDVMLALDMGIRALKDKSYTLWKESYEVEHQKNIRLEEKIKALEQEICEDAVSRKDVLLQLTGANLSTKSTDELIALFNKRIKSLPSVTPTRKKGKWIKHEDYYDCSLCGCLAPCTETADSFIWKLSSYCPDCGAEMENDFIKL